MTLNEKETTLLNELKTQEQHCIQKYDFFMTQAKSQGLKNLFKELKANEEFHFDVINDLLSGKQSDKKFQLKKRQPKKSDYAEEKDKEFDKYLCTDGIITEKYVATDYNNDLFYFASPELRSILNGIMTDEQNHAEILWDYKVANQMVG